jgi:hypothetical protein
MYDGNVFYVVVKACLYGKADFNEYVYASDDSNLCVTFKVIFGV